MTGMSLHRSSARTTIEIHNFAQIHSF